MAVLLVLFFEKEVKGSHHMAECLLRYSSCFLVSVCLIMAPRPGSGTSVLPCFWGSLCCKVKRRSCPQNILNFSFPGSCTCFQIWRVAIRAERGQCQCNRKVKAREKKMRCPKYGQGDGDNLQNCGDLCPAGFKRRGLFSERGTPAWGDQMSWRSHLGKQIFSEQAWHKSN